MRDDSVVLTGDPRTLAGAKAVQAMTPGREVLETVVAVARAHASGRPVTSVITVDQTLRAVVVLAQRAIEAESRLKTTHAVIDHVRGCFDAAVTEGLYEVLSETTDDRLKDLIERRLLHAYPEANP